MTRRKHLLNSLESEFTTCCASFGSSINATSLWRLANAMRELLLQFRIERDRAHTARLALKRLGDLRAQRAASVFGKFIRILSRAARNRRLFRGCPRDCGSKFLPRADSAKRAAPGPTVSRVGTNSFTTVGCVGLRLSSSILHILARKDFVAVALDRLRQMRHQHRSRIHDSESAHLGILAFHVGDPRRGQLEHRFDRRHAFENSRGCWSRSSRANSPA